ncbi:hypothetical protein AALO_G00151850 [Alosa alosa]|uniref:Sushi domain-containing protein n=1 Tax=Alosa alosa TaxID=278164 RepID=A0AAV6GE99_9TELE|nr:fibulin-7-like [Alosa alosa]KAG5273488.1 hypothetical protein AALO_G00151850 [Alosa alosa]
MKECVFFVVAVCVCQISFAQMDCPSSQELQTALRQVHKLLTAHETSYIQSLRNLRKKLNLLKTNTTKSNVKSGSNRNATCPLPEPLENGRRLGGVLTVGHEVHFLCSPGYELVGSETRVCHESLSWSGPEPYCKLAGQADSSVTSPVTPAPAPSPAPLPDFVRASRCIHLQGSTHCTCEVGYALTGTDNSICTDIDECELYRRTQSVRLCMHNCVNTAGSYHCVCPHGYKLGRDYHSCQDIDECETGQQSCTQAQVCVNTYGGYECVAAQCPHFRNATYVKTSALRCERNPCMVWDKACIQAPSSVSFQYMAVVSNMSAPRVLFRVSAARLLGDTLRFGLLGNRGRRHFSVQRSGQTMGQLLLVTPPQGPATLYAEVEMSELEKRKLLGRYVTKVTLFVSPYTF